MSQKIYKIGISLNVLILIIVMVIITQPPVESQTEIETITLRASAWQSIKKTEIPKKGQPLHFAVAHSVKINPSTTGTWQKLNDQTSLWRLRISVESAASINFGFTNYFMPPGGQLFFYTPDYIRAIRPFTQDDNKEHRQLWTPLLPPDIIIYLSIPTDELPLLQLELTTINIEPLE